MSRSTPPCEVDDASPRGLMHAAVYLADALAKFEAQNPTLVAGIAKALSAHIAAPKQGEQKGSGKNG